MLRDEVSTGDKQLYDENTSDKDDTETLNMLVIKYHKKVTADSKPNTKKIVCHSLRYKLRKTNLTRA